MPLRDRARGAGGVVGRHDLPWSRPEELVGLDERLAVAVHALDRVEALTRQRGQRKPDRDTDLADDPDAAVVVLGEQVVGLADRPRERALDRDDAGGGRALGDGLEDRTPSRHGGALAIPAEEGDHGLLGEGAGLALEHDGTVVAHARSVAYGGACPRGARAIALIRYPHRQM